MNLGSEVSEMKPDHRKSGRN